MITIYQSHSQANGYRLANLLHIQIRNDLPVIIAVGDATNWASSEPLPPDVESINLIPLSITEPKEAGEYWAKFLLHLVYQSNMSKPTLWLFGFGKIPVTVQIEDISTKYLVIEAISSCKLNKRFVVN